MTLASLVDQLTHRLTQPLPGRKAQLSLLSGKSLEDYEERFRIYEQSIDKTKARQSSVLILLYEKEEEIFIPLIRRPEYEGVHSGQIAFPGGKVEPDDEDIVATALRETFEEIGIPKEQIHILGVLTPVFIPPSNFWVNAVVGYTTRQPVFVPDAREVASIIEFPIQALEDISLIEERPVVTHPSWKMKATGYAYQDHFIWGATSLILTELRVLMAR